MKFKKLTTALATSSAFVVLATSAVFASTDVTISGNGADSVNTVKVNVSHSSSVSQSNVTKVSNHLSSQASTGGNTISKTTGGHVDVHTGDATSMVSVMVAGGDNHLVTNPCGCDNAHTNVHIKNNGADSTNRAKVRVNSSSHESQYSKTKVATTAYSDAKTGKNKVKKSTGGNTEVKTGDSESAVSVIVTGGVNHAQ